ncbi:MAG: DNA primase [candidate division WWE3 bacterium]|nr:DNA primase [candidate division WWE3 bacterium]
MDTKESPIKEIKSKISIVDLVSSYVPLKKSGRNYKGLCPFHNEKTPSFMVNPDLGMFKCFGCDAHGDQFEFIQQVEGVDFPEALKILGQKTGVEVKNFKSSEDATRSSQRDRYLAINSQAAEFFHFILTKHKIGAEALEYLHKRDVSDTTINEFKLGYAPNSWHSLADFLNKKGKRPEEIIGVGLSILGDNGRAHDRFRGRVMIPFFNLSNEVIGFTGRTLLPGEEAKYVNSPESPVFSKSNFLFGLNAARLEIKKSDLAIIVEGQMDFLTPFQAGFKNIVASGGTALTLGQLNLLGRYTKNLALCFDGDKAGEMAMRRAINLCEEKGFNVKLIILPKEFKDPDECVRHDPEIFKKAVNDALNAYDFYFVSAAKRFDLNSAVGKKEASNFLLPIIKEIPSIIEQAHYIQKAADVLKVLPEVISRALQSTAVKVDRDFKDDHQAISVSRGVAGREEFLLSTLLKAPINDILPIIDELAKKDFSENNQSRFEYLKEHLLLEPDMDITEFVTQSLEPDYWQNLLLLDSGDFKLEILLDLVKYLKKEALNTRLRELGGKIKTAEVASDKDKVAELRLESKEIYDKIGSL